MGNVDRDTQVPMDWPTDDNDSVHVPTSEALHNGRARPGEKANNLESTDFASESFRRSEESNDTHNQPASPGNIYLPVTASAAAYTQTMT